MYDYSGLPPELKEEGMFCLFRIEAKSRDAPKKDKIPYRRDGTRADSGNPDDYMTLAEAVALYQAGGYDGIGIGCFEDFVLVDGDDCIHDGQLDERGADIVSTLDSYTEVSVSGTGIHTIVYAKALHFDKGRYYINNRESHVEVYVPGVTRRFLTLTGKAIHGSHVLERTSELEQVLEKYMRRKESAALPQVQAPGSYLSDESILAKMQRSAQADKAISLMEGNIPDGKSHSEADMALAEILAFWCGGDLEQMDRLFRQSGLMREKWNRQQSGSTYGAITLEKAVKHCNTFYQPMFSDATEDFNDILTKLREFDILNNLRYRSDDIGFGRLFADCYKDIARYVPERKKWFIYDGKRWIPDTASLSVMEFGKDLADAMLIFAASIQDEVRRKAFMKSSKTWQQRRFRETYIKEAQSVYPVSMTKFDDNKFLFNCNNVTIDLKSHTVREHSPEDFLTKLSPVDYDPDASCDRFTQFISEVMSGDRDKGKYLQKSLGYGISGDTRYECMFFLYGETTRNGKGTLMESVLAVLGDYGKAVRPETIAQKHSVNSQSPSEDIARLAGIRFANISEPSRGLLLNTAQVKSMTGNDTLNARFLNENSFDFKPQFKLYVNTNYLPVITDITMFSSGRIIIIPFDRHFEEWEQDKTLKEEFSTTQAQSAILNWLLDGYWMLREEGFGKPKSVENAIAEYEHDSDKMTQFVEDRLTEDATAEIRTSAVYAEYDRWCKDNGCYVENNRNFMHELRKIGTVKRKRPQEGGEKTTVLIGYRLQEEVLFS